MNAASSSHAVYRSIREQILSGSLPPGTRLVNRTLGKNLGVSPVPVREALQRLVSDGVAEQIPGAGTFVRKLTKDDLIQIYAIRELLEGFAVAEAARSVRPDQIAELKEISQEGVQVARAIRDRDDQQATPDLRKTWLNVELAFHNALIDLAGNPWLSRIVQQIQLLSAVIQAKPRTVALSEVSRTCLDHARLIRAIEKGDADKAMNLMAKHLSTGMASQLLGMGREK